MISLPLPRATPSFKGFRQVYLASGKPYKQVFGKEGIAGVYHVKVLVVDETVAFNGSPNATNSSQVNGELAWRVTDTRVAADTCKEAWAEAQGVGSL